MSRGDRFGTVAYPQSTGRSYTARIQPSSSAATSSTYSSSQTAAPRRHRPATAARMTTRTPRTQRMAPHRADKPRFFLQFVDDDSPPPPPPPSEEKMVVGVDPVDPAEDQEDVESTYHLAIALYDFHEGDAAFHELCLDCQDLVLVTRMEEGADGWWEGVVLGSREHCLRQGWISRADGGNNADVVLSETLAREWLECIRDRVRQEERQDAQQILGRPLGYVPESYLQLLASPNIPISSPNTAQGNPEEDAVAVADVEEAAGSVDRSTRSFSQEELAAATHTAAIAAPAPTSDIPSLLPYLKRSLRRYSPFVASGAEEFVLTGGGDAPETSTKSTAKNSLGSLLSTFLGSSRTLSPATNPPLSNDIHYITDGPSWTLPKESTRYHSVSVGRPRHQRSWIQEWTVYEVESITHSPPIAASDLGHISNTVTVLRRYQHFHLLHSYLVQKFPMILVPGLPPRQYSGRFRDEFLDRRMRALARWLARIVRHPVLSVADAVTLFFTAGAGRSPEESAAQLEEGMKKLGLAPCLSLKHRQLATESYGDPDGVAMEDGSWVGGMGIHATYLLVEEEVQGATFYKYVYHPEFNLPLDDPSASRPSSTSTSTGSTTASQPFSSSSTSSLPSSELPRDSVATNGDFDSIQGGLQMIRDGHLFAKMLTQRSAALQSTLKQYRDVVANQQTQEMRNVSLALQRLVACGPSSLDSKGSSSTTTTTENEETLQQPPVLPSNHVWCYRGPSCKKCTHLTHSFQALATCMSALSTIQQDHAADTLTPLMEMVGEWSDPAEVKTGHLLQIHQEAVKMSQAVAKDAKKHRTRTNRSQEENGNPDATGEEDAEAANARMHVMARLQTVFNTTHAELDHWYHKERLMDWTDVVNTWIEGELAAMEDSIAVLHGCRAAIRSATDHME